MSRSWRKSWRSTRADKSGRSSFRPASDRVYIAFYKPYGILSQFSKEERSRYSTLAEFGFPAQVYPVGRLDADSEGLLILTDDSRMNDALLNPKHAHARTYLVQVENNPTREKLDHIRNGVVTQGRKTLPCRVRQLESEPELPPRSVPIRFRKNIPCAWLEIKLDEGKNRQVRRMTAAVGLPTLRLVRVAIGSLRLEELQLEPGQWKNLSESDTLLLFK